LILDRFIKSEKVLWCFFGFRLGVQCRRSAAVCFAARKACLNQSLKVTGERQANPSTPGRFARVSLVSFRAEATRYGGPPGRPRGGSARRAEQAKPSPPKSKNLTAEARRKAKTGSLLFGNDTEVRNGFVKMAGLQFMHCTTSQLIRSVKVRYSGSLLSLFKKIERL